MLLEDDRVSQSPYLFAGRPAVDRWLRRTGAGGEFELGRSMSTAQRRNVKDTGCGTMSGRLIPEFPWLFP